MAGSLPEDIIIFEIISRLPLKFLLRLTLICKRWHSLITNPNATEFHIAHASYNLCSSPSFIFYPYLRTTESGIVSILNKDHNNDSINRINNSIRNTCTKIFKSNEDTSSVYIVGSVHGLICFKTFVDDLFFIWNPVTNMYKTITKPSGKLPLWRSAFCYDAIDRDFKIMGIEKYETKDLVRVQVYSCNLDTWREINIRDDPLTNSEFNMVGFLKGRVYREFYSEPFVVSVVFDVHDEVFKQLPCFEPSIEGAKPCHYISWKGSLGLVVNKYKESNNRSCSKKVVYIYNETKGTWIEQYIVPDSLDPYKLLLGLENGDIVVHKDMRNFKLFEAESSRLKDITDSVALAVNVMSYTESLIYINGMQQV